MNDHQEPPKTVKEVGIHLVYMKEDMVELKNLVKELKDGYVTRQEFEEFRTETDKRFNETKRRTWLQNTLSAGAVLTLVATYAISEILNK